MIAQINQHFMMPLIMGCAMGITKVHCGIAKDANQTKVIGAGTKQRKNYDYIFDYWHTNIGGWFFVTSV
jgi:hypothetical protein